MRAIRILIRVSLLYWTALYVNTRVANEVLRTYKSAFIKFTDSRTDPCVLVVDVPAQQEAGRIKALKTFMRYRCSNVKSYEEWAEVVEEVSEKGKRKGKSASLLYWSIQYRPSHEKPKSVLSSSFLLCFREKAGIFLAIPMQIHQIHSWHEARQFLNFGEKKSQPDFLTTKAVTDLYTVYCVLTAVFATLWKTPPCKHHKPNSRLARFFFF